MSTYERPDQELFAELETLVTALTEELAGWRRRCLAAESELQRARVQGGVLAGPELAQARSRLAELESENAELRERLETVRTRVRALGQRFAMIGRAADGAA